MTESEMRRRIDTAFEFLGRVAEHPDRFPDEAVLFLMDPGEIASALTKERLRILRELEARAYPSLTALALRLGRDVSRLRKDMMAWGPRVPVAFTKPGPRPQPRPPPPGISPPLSPGRGPAPRRVGTLPKRTRAAHRDRSSTHPDMKPFAHREESHAP